MFGQFKKNQGEPTPEEKELQEKNEKLLTEKKSEVEARLGMTVLSWIITVDEGDNAFLFLRRPTAAIKRRALDKMVATEEIAETGKYLLDACMIKDESDSRFLDEKNPDNANLILTACLSVVDEIKVYGGVVKKK